MAKPFFESAFGIVTIDWMEKKENSSPTSYHYEKQPLSLQLHPKKPDLIVRAYFPGRMPSWIKKYAKEHDYQCKEVMRDGQTGWWLANWCVWESTMKPFSAPVIHGAIVEFINYLPDVCEEEQERLKEHADTIKNNLTWHPDFFEDIGVYYRPEEIKKQGGCLLIEDFVPKRVGTESDDEFRSRILLDGRLTKIVYELTTPLPEPAKEVDDEDISSDSVTEEAGLELDTPDNESLDLILEEEFTLEGIELEEEELGLELEELIEPEILLGEESFEEESEVEALIEEELQVEPELVSIDEDELQDNAETEDEFQEPAEVLDEEDVNALSEPDTSAESEEAADEEPVILSTPAPAAIAPPTPANSTSNKKKTFSGAYEQVLLF